MTEEHNPADQHNIFVARQPIFHTNQKIFGYELLFRNSLSNFFDPSQDGNQATSKVITNSFLLIGLRNLTGGKKAFINFTSDLLENEYPALLPKDILVVEVLEDVEATPAIIQACKNLRRQGYVLALDDFVCKPGYDPLIKIAHIVKIDISAMGRTELARQVEVVSGNNIILLAERVETLDDFKECKAMGFEYFQGYYFSKPNIIVGKDIPGSQLHYLRILNQIQDENYNFSKISDLFSHDVSMSYKLLKYVNSAFFSLPREIVSLQEAVVMVGEKNLRKWLSLMMLSYLAVDKPPELLRLCILRARFCEEIGAKLKGGGPGGLYTIGMFSLLDAILDQPMEKILDEIALSEGIKKVLLGKTTTGAAVDTLHLTQAYERGDWTAVNNLTGQLAISQDVLPLLFDDAVSYVNNFDML